MLCDKCGKELEQGCEFCKNCGAPVVYKDNKKKSKLKKVILSIVWTLVIVFCVVFIGISAYLHNASYDLEAFKHVSANDYLKINSKEKIKQVSPGAYEIVLTNEVVNSILQDIIEKFEEELPKKLVIKSSYIDTQNQKLYLNMKYGITSLPISCDIYVSLQDRDVMAKLSDFRAGNKNVIIPHNVVNHFLKDKYNWTCTLERLPKYTKLKFINFKDDKAIVQVKIDWYNILKEIKKDNDNIDKEITERFIYGNNGQKHIAKILDNKHEITEDEAEKLSVRIFEDEKFALDFWGALNIGAAQNTFDKLGGFFNFLSIDNYMKDNLDKIEVRKSEIRTILKPATISVMFTGNENTSDKFTNIISLFKQKYPLIDVKPIYIKPSSYKDKLSLCMAAKDLPSVFEIYGSQVDSFVEDDLLKDLSLKVSQNVDLDKFYALDKIKNHNGEYWYIPLGIDMQFLFYNKDIVDNLKFDCPISRWTVENLLSAAKKCSTKQHYGIYLSNAYDGYYPTILQFGGKMIDYETFSSNVTSDAKIRDAVRFLHDTVNTYGITPKKQSDPAWKLFANKEVAMVYLPYSYSQIFDELGINYEIERIPRDIESGGDYKINGIGMYNFALANSNDEDKQEAGWAFIKFLMQEDIQNIYFKDLRCFPINIKACEENILNKSPNTSIKRIFMENIEYIQFDENIDKIMTAFRQLDGYFAGEKSLDEGLEDTNIILQSLLDNKY